MKRFDWNAEKNRWLMENRGISFEDVLYAIQSGGLLDDDKHPNETKYLHQRMMVVNLDDYAWLVPYVEDNDTLFLKTIIPSRKATMRFLRG